MQAVGQHATHQEIDQLEKQIFSKITAKKRELTRGGTVELGSYTQKALDDYTQSLMQIFPRALNTSLFFNSYCTIRTRVFFKISLAQSVLDVLHKGKKIHMHNIPVADVVVAPVQHPLLGTVIASPLQIKVENLRSLPGNGAFMPIESSDENAPFISALSLPAESEHGSQLLYKKINILANVHIGNLPASVMEIELATVGTATKILAAAVAIPLTHLDMTGKIRWDGVITLPKNRQFPLSLLMGEAPLELMCDHITHIFNLKVAAANDQPSSKF